MEIKCGTDIIEIERIQKAIQRTGEKFVKTIFTENEIAYCESRKIQKYQHYAARFAAKEATFKALGNSLIQPFDWKRFEVAKMETGKPTLKIHYEIPNLQAIEISISHCKLYAVATVIAQFDN